MSSLFQTQMEGIIAIFTRMKEQYKSKYWGIFFKQL